VGYTLDELKNDITGDVIPASFEPSIDYVVVKIPRFNFDKFSELKPCLTTQMQSIGEVMAIGSTFQSALQKALCSLEEDLDGFNPRIYTNNDAQQKILSELCTPSALRLLYVADAFRLGLTMAQIHEHTKIDLWFLDQIRDLLEIETAIKNFSLYAIDHKLMLCWKQMGFSDARLSQLLNVSEAEVRAYRLQLDVTVKFKRIDSVLRISRCH